MQTNFNETSSTNQLNPGIDGVKPEEMLREFVQSVQRRADLQVYPLAGIIPGDVAEVLATVKNLDRDERAVAFSRKGDEYARRASEQIDETSDMASRYWLQAWMHYMFAGWPAQHTEIQRHAYRESLKAFAKYSRSLVPLLKRVEIPFEGKSIVGYLQLPECDGPCPLLISLGGLDEYKEYVVYHTNKAYVDAGIGVLALDMPGTGECPVKSGLESHRIFSKVLDAIAEWPEVDAQRVGIQGVSGGGYWSALVGHVEASRLRAAVVWGGPIHGYFQESWQRKSFASNEYLFGLKEARKLIWGFSSDEEFFRDFSKYSLEGRGVLQEKSAPMLVANGELDTQVPIDDTYLLLRRGIPKTAWVNPEGGHIGRSKNFPENEIPSRIIIPWLLQAFDSKM